MAVFTHMLLGSNFHPLPFRHGFVGSSSSIQIPKYSSPKLSKLPSTHQSIGWQCPLPSTFCAKNSFGHWPSKMSYRSLSPIAGYSGHIPGNKWIVGSNARRSRSLHINAIGVGKPQNLSQTMAKGMRKSETAFGNGIGVEWQPAEERDFDEAKHLYGDRVPLEERGQQQREASADGQSRVQSTSASQSNPDERTPKTRTMTPAEGIDSRQNGSAGSGTESSKSSGTGVRTDADGLGAAGKERANKLPPLPKQRVLRRRTPMDAFDDIQPGWWSEGQALKNLRAHNRAIQNEPNNRVFGNAGGLDSSDLANLTSNSAGLLSARKADFKNIPQPTPITATSNDNNILTDSQWEADIPAPGYSGHLTELHQTGVGKSYGRAVRESRRRQRHYQDGLNSGGGTFLSPNDSPAENMANGIGNNGNDQLERAKGTVSPY